MLAGCDASGEGEAERGADNAAAAARDTTSASGEATEAARESARETAPDESAGSDAAPTPGALAGIVVPSDWVLDPEPRSMRLATYQAPDPDGEMEIAVSRFGGRVGGELANVNRWRGQMGLPPVEAGGLDDVIQRFGGDGGDGYWAQIAGEAGVMVVAAAYQSSGDQTWFVRTTAPTSEAADRVEPAMLEMVQSVSGVTSADGDDGSAPGAGAEPPPAIRAWMDRLTVSNAYDPETGFIVARETIGLPAVFTESPPLDRALQQAEEQGALVIAVATADRCAPCQQYKKDALNDPRVIERLGGGGLLATHVEVDREPELADAYLGGRGIPMTYALRGGERIGVLRGQRSAEELLAWLDEMEAR